MKLHFTCKFTYKRAAILCECKFSFLAVSVTIFKFMQSLNSEKNQNTVTLSLNLCDGCNSNGH